MSQGSIVLSDIPICGSCRVSLISHSRVGVFDCNHLLCGECWSSKSESCKVCNAGRFIFILDEDPVTAPDVQKLRKVVGDFLRDDDQQKAQEIMELVTSLKRDMQQRIEESQKPVSKPAPKSFQKPVSQSKPLPPEDKIPKEADNLYPKAPARPVASQGQTVAVSPVSQSPPPVQENPVPKAPRRPQSKGCCCLL